MERKRRRDGEGGEGERGGKARERCKQGDIGKQGRRAAFESSAKSAFQPSILPRAASWNPGELSNGSRKHLAIVAGNPRARDPKAFLAPSPSSSPTFASARLYFRRSLSFHESAIFQERTERNGMEWKRGGKNKITRLILESGKGRSRSSLRRDEKSFSTRWDRKGERAQEEAKATGN